MESHGKTKKILVVDDDLAVRDFLNRFLTMYGFKVKLVMSGQSAIEVLKEYDFDIVFLDIRMPYVDGIKTYQELINIKPNLRFVLMSGYAVEDLIKDILNQDGVYFLKKPFDMEELNKVIEELVKY
ncbi:MAG: response regulator [Candidatus Omnitrophica bacterium]|nr:response regulator [Candidatus Omnitrophota bacterium]MCM8800040.1 response regulator [Candidatus Omnitrophota bacterium]